MLIFLLLEKLLSQGQTEENANTSLIFATLGVKKKFHQTF